MCKSHGDSPIAAEDKEICSRWLSSSVMANIQETICVHALQLLFTTVNSIRFSHAPHACPLV